MMDPKRTPTSPTARRFSNPPPARTPAVPGDDAKLPSCAHGEVGTIRYRRPSRPEGAPGLPAVRCQGSASLASGASRPAARGPGKPSGRWQRPRERRGRETPCRIEGAAGPGADHIGRGRHDRAGREEPEPGAPGSDDHQESDREGEKEAEPELVDHRPGPVSPGRDRGAEMEGAPDRREHDGAAGERP